MEFTIRMLVMIVLIVIVFVVLVALMAGWGGNIGTMIKGINDWFSQIFSGKAALPTGTLPGSTPATK